MTSQLRLSSLPPFTTSLTEAVLIAVAKAFGVQPEQVQNRSHQQVFQVWVYLLRRAVNLSLSLREVADKAGVFRRFQGVGGL